jgi:hypothetical protein
VRVPSGLEWTWSDDGGPASGGCEAPDRASIGRIITCLLPPPAGRVLGLHRVEPRVSLIDEVGCTRLGGLDTRFADVVGHHCNFIIPAKCVAQRGPRLDTVIYSFNDYLTPLGIGAPGQHAGNLTITPFLPHG